MKAIVQNGYGSPHVFEVKEIDKPVVEENAVLVRAHAAALHAGDYFAKSRHHHVSTAHPPPVPRSLRWCQSENTIVSEL